MAQIIAFDSDFHPGELAVHKLLRVPHRHNPTHHDLPPQLGYRVAMSPLVAVGTLDRRGRPWASVWGGEKGFAQPVAKDVLGVRATVGERWDPVVRELLAVEKEGEGKEDGDGRQIINDEVVKPEGGKMMAGLSIDPETRDRVKLAGAMAVGTATKTTPGVAELQLAFRVDEALGNCPKYINKKRIYPRVPTPRLESEGNGVPLPQAAIDLLDKADLFFVASKHGTKSMDVNIRGGPPGFVRVLRNREEGAGGTALVYPEYSGNRLYQTLGNIHGDPAIGIVVPDFETGDVLYITGNAAILVGEVAAAVMPHAKLAIRIEVVEARFVREGLSFRGEVIDYSPYNPAVRRLACEKGPSDPAVDSSSDTIATAKLVTRERLTPTISRYVFKLATPDGGIGKRLKAWQPGQHVTLDFSEELDMGYSHMRDEDPQSLNDDFVRTFTVSRPIDADAVDGAGDIKSGVEPELEITVRRHGPATALLERWNVRAPLEIPVLGFGGAEGFRLPTNGGNEEKSHKTSVFVAAGVGITPLMAQGAGVLQTAGEEGSENEFRLLWSIRGEDIPLAVDVLKRIPGLGSTMKLFVTGKIGEEERGLILGTIHDLGAEVLERRIGASDVSAEGDEGNRKYYLCAGPGMTRELLKWTEGEEVVYESFEY